MDEMSLMELISEYWPWALLFVFLGFFFKNFKGGSGGRGGSGDGGC